MSDWRPFGTISRPSLHCRFIADSRMEAGCECISNPTMMYRGLQAIYAFCGSVGEGRLSKLAYMPIREAGKKVGLLTAGLMLMPMLADFPPADSALQMKEVESGQPYLPSWCQFRLGIEMHTPFWSSLCPE